MMALTKIRKCLPSQHVLYWFQCCLKTNGSVFPFIHLNGALDYVSVGYFTFPSFPGSMPAWNSVLASFCQHCFHLCEKEWAVVTSCYFVSYKLLECSLSIILLCFFFYKNIIYFIFGNVFLVFRWSDVVRKDPTSNLLVLIFCSVTYYVYLWSYLILLF